MIKVRLMQEVAPGKIRFPKVTDPRGNLSFAEAGGHIPFPIRRVYYLYDIPGDEKSAGNADLISERVFLPLSGSVDLVVKDRESSLLYRLDRPDQGVYVPAGYWAELEGFTSGTLIVVLCSREYEEGELISDYARYADLGIREDRAKSNGENRILPS